MKKQINIGSEFFSADDVHYIFFSLTSAYVTVSFYDNREQVKFHIGMNNTNEIDRIQSDLRLLGFIEVKAITSNFINIKYIASCEWTSMNATNWARVTYYCENGKCIRAFSGYDEKEHSQLSRIIRDVYMISNNEFVSFNEFWVVSLNCIKQMQVDNNIITFKIEMYSGSRGDGRIITTLHPVSYDSKEKALDEYNRILRMSEYGLKTI